MGSTSITQTNSRRLDNALVAPDGVPGIVGLSLTGRALRQRILPVASQGGPPDPAEWISRASGRGWRMGPRREGDHIGAGAGPAGLTDQRRAMLGADQAAGDADRRLRQVRRQRDPIVRRYSPVRH